MSPLLTFPPPVIRSGCHRLLLTFSPPLIRSSPIQSRSFSDPPPFCWVTLRRTHETAQILRDCRSEDTPYRGLQTMLTWAGSFPDTEGNFVQVLIFCLAYSTLIILLVILSRFRTAQLPPLHPGQNTSVGLCMSSQAPKSGVSTIPSCRAMLSESHDFTHTTSHRNVAIPHECSDDQRRQNASQIPRLATKWQRTVRNTYFLQATPSVCVSCTPSF